MEHVKKLKYGWTTGACATAAAKAAYLALKRGFFSDRVTITLPQGKRVSFRIFNHKILDRHCAIASVIKDAGDDPDVTHGAEIRVRITILSIDRGIVFKAGKGVGTVTKPGLQLPVGQPAINPVPRQMIRYALNEVFPSPDVEVEISVVNGEELAKKTMNPRLGIMGGLSILGTTGIVVPFSCAAWIASIHRGIDVARAANLTHLIASVGNVSEETAKKIYTLPESAFIEMGDFVGGVLKYLKTHPVQWLTLAGGVAKFTKLAQGHLDLHSGRSQVDFAQLAEWVAELGAEDSFVEKVRLANTALEVFRNCHVKRLPLADLIAEKALAVVKETLDPVIFKIEILMVDRKGNCLGRAFA